MQMFRWSLSGIAALLAVSAQADTVKLNFVPSGASRTPGVYRPQRLNLTPTQPDSVKKSPENLTKPLYGALQLGPKEHARSVLLLLDTREGQEPRFFVDTNLNGDLTDDPAPEWKPRPFPGNPDLRMYQGSATIEIDIEGERVPFRINFLRLDNPPPNRADLKFVLTYFSDYAYEGTIDLGGKSYRAMLTDDLATGDFRGQLGEKVSGARLLIDVNANGIFDTRGEMFDVQQPFNIKGVTYEITDLQAFGGAFQVVKSKKTVPEILPPPDLRPGKPALAFEAKTTDGQTIKFPESFKGKIVLLNFWATWSGPCVRELPNLTRAYKMFQDKGFEILSISLDQENASAKLTTFAKEHEMPWPQVYDGKYWQAAIAQLYFVDSLPSGFLVDGDTGLVLAGGPYTRGDKLTDMIQRSLARKKR